MLTVCSRRYVAAILLLFLLAGILFYPSNPEIGLDRIRLNHIEIQTTPKPTLNLSFSLTVKVRNRDFFPLSYDSLDVSVSYHGRQIGFVSPVAGGCIRGRGSSYVDVVLTVDGFEVIYDALYLLQDIAEGLIPIDTYTRVDGKFGRFFFDVPLKATVSRQVYVNINSAVVNINRVVGNIKGVFAAVALVDNLISAILSVFLNQGWIWKLLTYLTGKMLVVCSRRYSAAILLLFLLAVPIGIFVFYPSDPDPEIQLDRIRLNHIRIQTTLKPTLDLLFSLTVKVRNRDFFPLSYDSLNVSVGYRGHQLGFVSSIDGGCIRVCGSAYVDVVLTVNGFKVIDDAFYLLQDIAKGVIPFDTDTRVEGKFGLFFFNLPLKSLGDTVDQNLDNGAGDT